MPDEMRVVPVAVQAADGREGLPLPLTTNVMTMMMIAVITLHPVRLLVLPLHCHGLILNLLAASPA